MKKITVDWLETKMACSPKIEKFKQIFGESAEVSYENCEIWRKNNKQWRSDMMWLFRATVTCSITKKNSSILNKLLKHLGKHPSQFDYIRCGEANGALALLKPQRFVYAITQIIHMA